MKIVVETHENGILAASLVDDKNQVVSRITSTTSGSRTMKIVVETHENGILASLVDDKNQVVSRITSAGAGESATPASSCRSRGLRGCLR